VLCFETSENALHIFKKRLFRVCVAVIQGSSVSHLAAGPTQHFGSINLQRCTQAARCGKQPSEQFSTLLRCDQTPSMPFLLFE
jgi:Skp family chaperone for outer membrane proteins